MSASPVPDRPQPQLPAQLAKAALRRLALDRLEPTPENYAAAYLREQGVAPAVAAASPLPARLLPLVERLAQRAVEADAASSLTAAMAEGRWDAAERLLDVPDTSGATLASLIDRVVRGVERGGRQWTLARRKDSLQRVLDGGRGDAARLRQRLGQLLNSWDSDTADAAPEAHGGAAVDVESAASRMGSPVTTTGWLESPESTSLPEAPASAGGTPAASATTPAMAWRQPPDATAAAATAAGWHRVVGSFDRSVRQALPQRESTGRELAEAIGDTTRRLQAEGATQELADELERLCERADWVLQHRDNLMEQLGALCHELTDSLAELAEDDSWARGQCEAMRARLADGLTARGVKAVGELLRVTRERQAELRVERDAARQALKLMIQRMLADLSELGSHTGRFQDNLGRYADVVESADSLEGLAGAVHAMVEESRAVYQLVSQTRQRLNDEHSRAGELTRQVERLEAELRRLADEVLTDPLTQIANRRGLVQAFESERARASRAADGAPAPATMSIGLIDIDNFKRLNDELGHAAGDQALKALAATVARELRPTDVVARYGGEEFVVLLPQTEVDEGGRILTRLQRSLTGGLFMHEHKQVLVTFSAGITAYRDGERIEDALERADQALYEAKRTGKNRTCNA